MSGRSDDNLLRAVGARVRAARAAERLNLSQLARLTGISPAALSMIETGKRDPRITTLNRIASALRVPLSSLVEHRPAGSDEAAEGSPPNRGHDLGDFLE